MDNILFFIIGFFLGIIFYNEIEKARERQRVNDIIELLEQAKLLKKDIENI